MMGVEFSERSIRGAEIPGKSLGTTNYIWLLMEVRAYSVCQARAACSLTGNKLDEGSGCKTNVAG
jgi:hypothetical protein